MGVILVMLWFTELVFIIHVLIKIRCTFGPVLWNSLIFLLVKLCKCFQILFKTKCGVAMTLLNAFIFICINRTFLTDKNSLNILLILEWNLCLQIKIMILFKKKWNWFSILPIPSFKKNDDAYSTLLWFLSV